MGLNFMDLAKEALTSQVIGKASEFLGEDAESLTKGFGAAVPSILGSIVSRSSDTSGAGNLLGMLKEGGFDGSMMDNLGDVFSGGASTSGALDAGGGLLKMFLGDKIGGVAEIISKVSGIGSGSSNKVLSLVVPMLMNMIGRVVKNKALDAIGLGKLMGSQGSSIASALPAGMGSLLGLDNILGGATKAVSETVGLAANKASSTQSGNTASAAPREMTTESGSSFPKWLIPLALVAVLGYFGISKFGCADKAKDAMDDVTAVAKDGIDKAGDMASDAATSIGNVANKALEGIKFTAGSVGDQFSKFLASGGSGDQSFKFNNLNFATGSGNIDGSAMEIDNLAAVLKAYPDVTIEINGYTDSQGNDDNNQALSELRANTVLQKLISNGIDVSRLSAVGHGEADPIGDNNTAEGRAMNRRIEVKVTSR